MGKSILVVTATLGDRNTLKETIGSVRRIGGDKVQHVIICPDEKVVYLKKLYSGDNLIVEPQPDNIRGIYKVLNYAFRKYARDYDYVTFLNDDDYWLPGYSNIIIRALECNDDLVYGRTIYIDEYGNRICQMTTSRYFKLFLDYWKFGIVMLTQQSVLFKSSLFFKIGGFYEDFKLVSDTKFWIDISLISSLKYNFVNRECAAYRIMKDQLSSNKSLLLKENSEMRALYKSIRTKSYAGLLYRLENIMIYVKRMLNGQGVKDPFNK